MKTEKCPIGRWSPGSDCKTRCFQCVFSDHEKIIKNWGNHCSYEEKKCKIKKSLNQKKSNVN